ncbi:hypothetical protein CISIN_1g0418312mg, partial [Citrus sinensis]
MYKVKK